MLSEISHQSDRSILPRSAGMNNSYALSRVLMLSKLVVESIYYVRMYVIVESNFKLAVS